MRKNMRSLVMAEVGMRLRNFAIPGVCILAACASAPQATWARGVSPYLPLNLAPEIERQIEQVMILADKPVMSRPIAAATVLDALPAACKSDPALCKRVRRYLNRYMEKLGLGNVSLEIAAANGASQPLPNRHGMYSDSAWAVSADGYMRVGDYVLVSVGGVAHEDEAVPTGTVVSMGYEYAQLDVGFRDHWFSPFTDSSMVISTNAATLASVTLSNYTPISFAGLHYEVFLAEMEESDRILYQDRFTSGKPRLAGLRLAVEPVPGWSLAGNRMLQFGGGERGGTGIGDFVDALLRPHEYDNTSATLNSDAEFGNQVAAWTSRFVFPGKTPFAVYLEYAGEDSSYEGNFRLGNASLSMGVTFPRLWQRFDLTYEVSEWQNGWYVNAIYGDGLTNDGRVLGHWGGDQRTSADAVGAQSHMLRVGWEPQFGGLLQVRARTLANESYTAIDYERAYDLSVSYSRAIRGFTAGGEITSGRDVFGESFGRLAGYVRFGDEWASGGSDIAMSESTRPEGADLFVDAGVNISKVQIELGDGVGDRKRKTSSEVAPHVGFGARRAVSAHNDLGVRVELDRVNDELLLSVRALDYRYRFDNPLALTAFVGAARYDLATPAYGYYFGAGAQWRDVMPHFDVSVDLRYMDKMARDKLLPTDPPSTLRPDSFYDVSGATVSLSYRF